MSFLLLGLVCRVMVFFFEEWSLGLLSVFLTRGKLVIVNKKLKGERTLCEAYLKSAGIFISSDIHF